MTNTPKIRFKGFVDDWEQRKCEGILKPIKGAMKIGPFGSALKKEFYTETGVKVYAQENIFQEDFTIGDYYISEEKYQSLKGCKLEPGDLVISMMGTIGACAIFPEDAEPGIMNSHLLRLQLKDDIHAEYIHQLLRDSQIIRNQIDRLSVGSIMSGLSSSVVQRLVFPIPSLAEQKKIAGFLTQIDKAITLHQRKCDETKELKKYMLQKMFPKNGMTKPEIRFKGFTDDWEQRKLGTLCERVTRKNKNGESDLPLTIASQYGLIDQRDFFNKVVAAKDMSNYYLLKKGEFAYNKSYSNGFDYGSIKRLNAYEQGCLSTLYICFGITSDDIESDYLECFFDTLKWYSDITMICAEGARNHGLLNVDTKAFFDEVTIEMPSSKEEQRKISEYLNNLDNLIILHQRKCDELKEAKKYMLQNMFPKKG